MESSDKEHGICKVDDFADKALDEYKEWINRERGGGNAIL